MRVYESIGRCINYMGIYWENRCYLGCCPCRPQGAMLPGGRCPDLPLGAWPPLKPLCTVGALPHTKPAAKAGRASVNLPGSCPRPAARPRGRLGRVSQCQSVKVSEGQSVEVSQCQNVKLSSRGPGRLAEPPARPPGQPGPRVWGAACLPRCTVC